ncbi:MAG: ABC transporter permease [Thermofilum sp.]
MQIPLRVWNRYRMQIAVLAIFLLLYIVFFAINPFAFTNPYTYTSLMSIIPPTIIGALGLTFVIILGEIDLSFPSMMGLGAWANAVLWHAIGPHPVTIILAVAAGFLAGALNGVIITRWRIPSFIATLGTMFFWKGVLLLLTQGFAIPLFMFRGSLLYNALVGRVAGIPLQMVWAIVTAVVLWVLLNRHRFGAHVYYVGDNRYAAEALGISASRVVISVFALNGALSAFAGVLASLEVATYWPTIGDGYLLEAIAAVVLGGTLLTGGSGSLFGTFIGALTLGLIRMGVLSAGATGFWIPVMQGFVILASLIVQYSLRYKGLGG